jgi:pimeloyl-ACP methyl ester carboxylesterase
MPTPPSTSPRADLTLALPHGRTLAYAEWGDPAGQPVLFLHRSPGSRLFDPGPDATAAVRLITVDRPGYGGTDPVAEPSFSAAAADLAALGQELDLQGVALMGWSGGGQFALASLSVLGDRVASLTLIVTPAPDEEIPWYPEYSRPMLEAARADPAAALPKVAEQFEALMADPDSLGATDPSPADADTRTLPGVLEAHTTMMREAGRQRGAGTAFDVVAGGRGHPLPIAAVDVPTRLWYGANDEYIGAEHGCWYHERIAGSRLEEVDGAGHLLPILCWPEILASARV